MSDLDDELVDRLAAEAEQGYDVDRLRPRLTVCDGLPDGWTFRTIARGERVTYEVRTADGVLVMFSTWHREWFTDD